ncbi:MAG: hypothetical protein ACUVTD_03945 [Nitrososphaerales archaeon]
MGNEQVFPPSKDEIRKRALKLFYKDNPNFLDHKPEEYELRERIFEESTITTIKRRSGADRAKVRR